MLFCCCSVAKSCLTFCDPVDISTPGSSVLQSPGVCSNFCALNWWSYLSISSSAIPFSFCLKSFPASESFKISRFFASGGQIIGVSASALVPPMKIQIWFLLGLTGFISLLSKGLSRVFSSTTIWRRPFFNAQFSSVA